MHKTDSSTTPPRLQAKNITLPLLQLKALRQHLGDIDSLGYTAVTLIEIAYDQIDPIGDTGTVDMSVRTAVMRIDALVRSVHRSVLLMQESAADISLALDEVGGVQ